MSTGLNLIHEHEHAVRARWQGIELFGYVYRPGDAQYESPRPYFHPVRTLGGDVVSIFRPHDHLWHKGIALSLPYVGQENFWGGPTFVRDRGYQRLENNGAMVHEFFEELRLEDGAVTFTESLAWHAQAGARVIEERRHVSADVLAESGAWRLSFATTLNNVSGSTITFGSPTTNGRENAGYGGLFWRGPRSFTGGTVTMPEGSGGDELMGKRAPWVALTGRHDETDCSSTLLMRESPDNFSFPNQWFVRSSMFACIGSAPFFSEEHDLADGTSLTLGYEVFVIYGAADKQQLEALTDLPWSAGLR
jgi:hypothetical protein